MSPAAPSPPRRLLIVEDDPELLLALTFLADTWGFDSDGCESGAEALGRMAARNRYSCLIIDQRLPDTLGLDLIGRLRAAKVDTPALLITTQPSQELRRQATQIGVPIVEKPLLNDTLLSHIHNVIGPR